MSILCSRGNKMGSRRIGVSDKGKEIQYKEVSF